MLGKKLADLLFPTRCIFCGRIVETDDPRQACRRCIEKLARPDGVVRGANPALHFSPFLYVDGVRRALSRLKFHAKTSYARPLAYFMANEAQRRLEILPDIIVWAPVSAKRLHERGFDQAQLLAEEVARLLKIPIMPALEKIKDTPPQSSIRGAAARAKNIRGAYRCSSPDAVNEHSILLIDDIRTTGATLRECAAMLTEAGASSVTSLTAAMTK